MTPQIGSVAAPELNDQTDENHLKAIIRSSETSRQVKTEFLEVRLKAQKKSLKRSIGISFGFESCRVS